MKKAFSELTIKDDFMFGVVMMEEENCRGMLELILPFPIGTIEVRREESLKYHPEFKGVRLDVSARGEMGKRYNIEMQTVHKPALGKRARYYSSQMDMDLLGTGGDYTEITDTYVIFVCDFDPFNAKRYLYSFATLCKEEPGLSAEDGRYMIFLNTKGTNDDEVSPELAAFLKYVGAGREESEADYGSPYVDGLQKTVQRLRQSWDMEVKYMSLELAFQDERREGYHEGLEKGQIMVFKELIARILQKKGNPSVFLLKRICSEQDLAVLKQWCDIAMEVSTIEQFEEMTK